MNLLTYLSKLRAFVFSIVFIFSFACSKNKTVKTVDPDFKSFVAAFTGGLISCNAAVVIKMVEPLGALDENWLKSEQLIQIDPSVEGVIQQLDEYTLAFKPNAPFRSGQKYMASFALHKLLPTVPSKLKSLDFSFQILPQHFEILFEGFEELPGSNSHLQKLSGSVEAFDYLSLDLLKANTTATQGGKKLKIIWPTPAADSRKFEFVIDSVQRGDEPDEVKLTLDAKALGANSSTEAAFRIPSINDFSIVNIRNTADPEKVISIYFSDELLQKQDLKGMVSLSNNEIKMIREGNKLLVYPQYDVQGSVILKLSKAIKNKFGLPLQADYEQTLVFESLKPAIQLIGKGNIIPSGGGLNFPFRAVNLSGVNVKIIQVFEHNMRQFLQTNQLDGNEELRRVGKIVYGGTVQLKSSKNINYGKWNNFSLELAKLIEPEPGALYHVELSFDASQSLYPCADASFKNKVVPFQQTLENEKASEAGGEWYYYGYDDYYYYNFEDDDDNDYSQLDNPCHPYYYKTYGRKVSRNVLASDLGIIAKAGLENTLNVAITDLNTTEPMSGVEVEAFNYQSQPIQKGKTGSDGLLQLRCSEKPYVLVASKGKQRGYLRIDDASALSLSMFDVSGQQVAKGLKGFIYGERGVWRPGDSLFITFLLEDKNKVLPAGHPVVMELYSPQMQLIERKVKVQSKNGFYDFRTATAPDAPTGDWLAKVKVGGTEFVKYLKIETVKPNRLKMELNFAKAILTKTEPVEAELSAQWLHGSTAAGLRATVELSLSRSTTKFKGFEKFNFDDNTKSADFVEQLILDQKLDNNGRISFNPDLSGIDNMPGMMNANFRLRVFEAGGDFSVDRVSVPFSPYTHYAGLSIKNGSGWNGALTAADKNPVQIVCVNELGKPVAGRKLQVELYKVKWRWWYEANTADALYNDFNYTYNFIEQVLLKKEVSSAAQAFNFDLNLKSNDYGRYMLKVTDLESGHSVTSIFYVSSAQSDDREQQPEGAEMLTFQTDKTTYHVGERMKVTIPAARQGRVLVSLETGAKVLKNFWQSMSTGSNTFEIAVTEDMAPNVYLHLSLIQPHKNTINDLPIRLYGVQSVKVEDAQTVLYPQISMPAEVRPEQTFEVRVNEKNGRKMTYTLAVVEEGLLGLTRFKTPDPWSVFYAREALSVRSFDVYKYVLGAFAGEMAGLLALGGDEYEHAKKSAKANRFKPVVQFLGTFELKAKEQKVHKVTLPNYIGAVRVMLVAADNGAYGNTEQSVQVKKPLMVLATLPRVLSPGEIVSLPVTVFAMDEKIKKVDVAISTDKMLTPLGAQSKTISFSKTGEKIVPFELSVANLEGIAKVHITVKSGSESAKYNLELNVRSPNPPIVNVSEVIIEPGQTWIGNYKAIGMQGTNSGSVEVSTLPAINLHNRLNYLITYPHGCIEQITSSAFPQLYLAQLTNLTAEDKNVIENHIKSTLNAFRNYQLSSGGFSYWPGGTQASDWGTSYAGHFMLEARQKGYALPDGLLTRWLKFQKSRSNSWTEDKDVINGGSSDVDQAYRLYTLALAGDPHLGAMNRLRSAVKLSGTAKWRLAAAYLIAGKFDVATEIIKGIGAEADAYKHFNHTYGSAERDEAMILETLLLLNKRSEAYKLLQKIARRLSSDQWYSTQTTAYSLLAVSKFIGSDSKGAGELKYTYTTLGKTSKIRADIPYSQQKLSFNNGKGGSISINNEGTKPLFVKLVTQGKPAAGQETSTQRNMELNIQYKLADGSILPFENIEQGTDFIAVVTVKNTSLTRNLTEMALTQIFPAGWEIRNKRMEAGTEPNTYEFDYQDIRDDRVLTYFSLDKGQTKTFQVALNAAYQGKFYHPATICQAMYDNEIYAVQSGRWVQVVHDKGMAVK
jgi:uncharacterized protein YfaS (alpha-2-macroglobulin family)